MKESELMEESELDFYEKKYMTQQERDCFKEKISLAKREIELANRELESVRNNPNLLERLKHWITPHSQ